MTWSIGPTCLVDQPTLTLGFIRHSWEVDYASSKNYQSFNVDDLVLNHIALFIYLVYKLEGGIGCFDDLEKHPLQPLIRWDTNSHEGIVLLMMEHYHQFTSQQI